MSRTALLLWLALGSSAAAAPCASDPRGWCEAPAGDPCGRHRTEAACRGDAQCFGIAYRGESMIACQRDERNFGTNCPTVGCASAPR